MQVVLQTKLNAPTMIYDSRTPEDQGEAKGIGKAILQWLMPALQIKQGNTELYKTRAFYPDESMQYKVAGVGIVVGLFVGYSWLVRNVGR